MPLANHRKRQKVFRRLGFALTNFWTTIHEKKIRKNIDPENFVRNVKQEFPYQSLESFSGEYYNMETKIFGFQFGPLCANQTHPNYTVGSEQDEAEILYDRWSTPEWCNWRMSKDINQLRISVQSRNSDSKAFHLKFKARLSWITAVLKIFAVEFDCVANHFLEEFFSEIS